MTESLKVGDVVRLLPNTNPFIPSDFQYGLIQGGPWDMGKDVPALCHVVLAKRGTNGMLELVWTFDQTAILYFVAVSALEKIDEPIILATQKKPDNPLGRG
jgi:hypothetical protein